MVRISLIVPTYNRANYLEESLPSFINQTLDKNLYEIIVIDNNSTDETKCITERLLSTYQGPWRYIFEPKQGLHYARNRGLLEGCGDIIVFGDDDIIACDQWLEFILREFDEHSKTGIVGGKVLPNWKGVPPEWIYDYGTEKTHTVFAYMDYGQDRKILENGYVFGCNFAVRRDLAIKVGGSTPDTFPKKLKHLSGGGECDLIDRIRALGVDVVYLPEALVRHCAEASRATLSYFIDRHERFVIENIRTSFSDTKKLPMALTWYSKALRDLCNIYRLQFENVIRFCLKKKYKPYGKNNPKYFLVIRKKVCKKIFIQVTRILISPSLYRYITKKNFLTD